MSSFNNGEKDTKKDQAKDSLYLTFLTCILLLLILRYIILIFKRIFFRIDFCDGKNYINCYCSKCEKRFDKYYSKIRSQNINKKLLLYIFLLVILIFLFIDCCKKVQNNSWRGFDPYEILEISESASISDIKKSYKNLSLKYHPDKNQNDKKAKEKFMNINKAYRALTDEKAKENYKKYGNPDGPGLLSYGFALPFFLFEGKIGFYVLLILAISMIIIFPILFLRWFKNSKKYDNDGFSMENLSFYYQILNKDILITHLPFIIGMSKEFNEMDINYDEEEIKKLFQVFVPYFPKNSNYKNITFKNKMAITLLYIHYSNSTVIIEDKQSNEAFQINQDKIIVKSKFLIDQLIKNVLKLNKIYEFNKGLKELLENANKNDTKIELYQIKEFDFNLIKTLINFRARLFHETNIKLNNDELLLFPNNKDNIPIFEKNNYLPLTKTIYNLLIKKNGLKNLNNIKDIDEVVSIIPHYSMKVDLSHEIFPEEYLIKFKICIDRKGKNIINDEKKNKIKLGFLHSNNYCEKYEEEIIVIILDKDKKRINYYQKATFTLLNEQKLFEYSMLVEKPGKNCFEVYCFSLSYPGLSLYQNFNIEMKEKNNLINNFIKNRYNNILSKEEFEETYILNKKEKNSGLEKHEHED